METGVAVLLLAMGVYASIRTGLVQVRGFLPACRAFFAGAGRRGDGRVTPFQAAATALAATIGTGNIAGTAGAILLGGPGAVFWMWVSAFFGMALKYAEIRLAMRYRVRAATGEWVGGPMYMIEQGLPRRWRPLAAAYAAAGAAAAFGMGNLIQVNTVAESVRALAQALPGMAGWVSDRALNLATGLLTATAVGAAMLGGAKRIGRIAERLVPAMCILFIGGSAAVLIVNRSLVPAALSGIFRGAFRPEAVLGGACGIGLRETLRVGVLRGVLTHEAGLGTSAIAHASADAGSEHAQALFGVFEVFFDTVVLCTLTALVLLSSGIPVAFGSDAENGAIVGRAFATLFGGALSGVFLTLALALFAVASILAFSLYGVRCFSYLTGGRAIFSYKLAFCLCVVWGAVMDLSAAWRTAEILNVCMAVPNLMAVGLLLSRQRLRD